MLISKIWKSLYPEEIWRNPTKIGLGASFQDQKLVSSGLGQNWKTFWLPSNWTPCFSGFLRQINFSWFTHWSVVTSMNTYQMTHKTSNALHPSNHDFSQSVKVDAKILMIFYQFSDMYIKQVRKEGRGRFQSRPAQRLFPFSDIFLWIWWKIAFWHLLASRDNEWVVCPIFASFSSRPPSVLCLLNLPPLHQTLFFCFRIRLFSFQ